MLERLAALVPPPRRPLLAYHGVLAPHTSWRAAIVPAAPSDAQPTGPEAPRSPGRLSWATLLRRVFAIEVLVCLRCAGPRRILDTATETEAVRRLLGALGLAAPPPPHRSVTAPWPAVDPGVHPQPPPSQSARRPLGAGSHLRLPIPSRPALALAGPAGRALESDDPGNASAGLTAGSGRGQQGFAPPRI